MEQSSPAPNHTAPGAPTSAPAAVIPTVRRDGNLVVTWPTNQVPRSDARTRSHVAGPLNAGGTRLWAGPTQVPDWLVLRRGVLELYLLDETAEAYIALYREPYDARPTGCSARGPRAHQNCEFVLVNYARDQSERWVLRLNDYFSRPDHLELQDVRYAGGVVYFNEACQSYSREAGGRCSSLIGLDPMTREVRLRTPPLVSNGEIAVLDSCVITAYGFTGEKDQLALVSRDDGRVLARMDLPVAAAHLTITSSTGTQAFLDVDLKERAEPWRIQIDAIDQRIPRFIPIGPPPAPLPSEFQFPTLRRGMRDPHGPP